MENSSKQSTAHAYVLGNSPDFPANSPICAPPVRWSSPSHVRYLSFKVIAMRDTSIYESSLFWLEFCDIYGSCANYMVDIRNKNCIVAEFCLKMVILPTFFGFTLGIVVGGWTAHLTDPLNSGHVKGFALLSYFCIIRFVIVIKCEYRD